MAEIKNRWTGEVIATGETIKKAAEKNRGGLGGANLRARKEHHDE